MANQGIWSLYLKSTDIVKKLHIEISYDPTVPLGYIYPRVLKTHTYITTCTQVVIAAFFIVVKKWKQPKCASADKWINKNMLYPGNGILFSHKH